MNYTPPYINPDLAKQKPDNEFGIAVRPARGNGRAGDLRVLALAEVERVCDDHLKTLRDKAPAIEAFEKSVKYANKFKKVSSIDSCKALRQQFLNNRFTDREAGCLVNLMPYTKEEAKALIPSLAKFDGRAPDEEKWDNVIEDAIQNLVYYKEQDIVL